MREVRFLASLLLILGNFSNHNRYYNNIIIHKSFKNINNLRKILMLKMVFTKQYFADEFEKYYYNLPDDMMKIHAKYFVSIS